MDVSPSSFKTYHCLYLKAETREAKAMFFPPQQKPFMSCRVISLINGSLQQEVSGCNNSCVCFHELIKTKWRHFDPTVMRWKGGKREQHCSQLSEARYFGEIEGSAVYPQLCDGIKVGAPSPPHRRLYSPAPQPGRPPARRGGVCQGTGSPDGHFSVSATPPSSLRVPARGCLGVGQLGPTDGFS